MNNQFFTISKNIFDINSSILNEYENILFSDEFKINNNLSVLRNENEINNFVNIKKLLSDITKFIEKKSKKLIFDDIWIEQSTSISTNKNSVPYIPHIDKIRKYKIMIYLSDVKKDSGPLYLINIDPDTLDDKRKKFSKNYKEKGENIISDHEIVEYKPCLGNFGTTIFFDTNTPHFAGKVYNNEKKRKILRFSFRYVDSFTKNINLLLKGLRATQRNHFFYNY
jgi:hypothetical protein